MDGLGIPRQSEWEPSPGPSGRLKRTGGLPRSRGGTPAQPPERGKAVPPAKENRSSLDRLKSLCAASGATG